MEYLVQMGPMLILAALTAGWLMEAFATGGGHGLIPDMTLGLIGSVVVGTIVWTAVSSELGMVAMFLIGGGSAGLAIAGQRKLWRSTRLGT